MAKPFFPIQLLPREWKARFPAVLRISHHDGQMGYAKKDAWNVIQDGASRLMSYPKILRNSVSGKAACGGLWRAVVGFVEVFG